MKATIPVFVGLDYHATSIQVCVMDASGNVLVNRACPNSVAAVAACIGPQRAVAAVALEACCGTADFGQRLHEATGWKVQLGHAGYMARLKGSPDKTDFADARVAADLTRVGYLPTVYLPPLYERELRQLVRYRQRLVDRQRALKLQVGALLREYRLPVAGPRWSNAWCTAVRAVALPPQGRFVCDATLAEITHVQALIKAAEDRLEAATATDATVQRLRGMDGIGPVTAWALRAFVGDFGRFATGKKLARYCGLSPKNASSGSRQADAGLIDAADGQLRALLIQAAHRLVHQKDSSWQKLFKSLQARGKPYNLAVAAVANRWVRKLHYQMTCPVADATPVDVQGQDAGGVAARDLPPPPAPGR